MLYLRELKIKEKPDICRAMPKKGRYADLAKFPPNRIKKIMQTDKEVTRARI